MTPPRFSIERRGDAKGKEMWLVWDNLDHEIVCRCPTRKNALRVKYCLGFTIERIGVLP
ncbi:MAG TPA: hypothetical protein VIV56_07145 [Gemmatimonadales bacterium]